MPRGVPRGVPRVVYIQGVYLGVYLRWCIYRVVYAGYTPGWYMQGIHHGGYASQYTLLGIPWCTSVPVYSRVHRHLYAGCAERKPWAQSGRIAWVRA